MGAALQAVSWTVRRNLACPRASQWPAPSPEPSYPGVVDLPAADCFPAPGAAFTDGFLGRRGGAAVWLPDSENSPLVAGPEPRSSTHCELAALGTALQLCPSKAYSDSPCSLQLLLC